MPNGFNYDIAMLIIVVGWVSVGISYMYCLNRYGGFNRVVCLLFSMLFVACPIWVEQNYFVCSVFVNVIGFLFAVWIAYMLVEKDNVIHKGIFCVGIIGLIIFVIGIYQAILYLVVANYIIFLMLKLYVEGGTVKDFFIQSFIGGMTVALSTILYFVCSKLAVRMFWNPAMDYVGFSDPSVYMSSRLNWMKGDIFQCVQSVWMYIMFSVDKNNVYGAPILLVLWILVEILYLFRSIIKKDKSSYILVLGNAIVLICVYMGTILLGGSITIREQFILPLAVAFLTSQLVNEVLNSKLKNVKFMQIVLTMMCIYGLVCWGDKQLQLNRSDYIRYNCDVSVSNYIMNEVNGKIEDYSSKKIVFVGQNTWKLPENNCKGEVVGYSILSWDAGGPAGVNYRTYGFLNCMGYSYQKPTLEDIQTVKTVCETQDIFGNERVSLLNDIIVVNLDEF